MTQTIEARLLNPETAEQLADEITLANSHRHAIELTVKKVSLDRVKLGELVRIPHEDDGKWVKAGTGGAWKYFYSAILIDEEEEKHQVIAILFAQYKEKEQGA